MAIASNLGLTALLKLVASVLFLSGCSSLIGERHFFRSVDRRTGATINYYRLRVSGFTLFSSSRYVSGFFDENAVDSYFGEIKQPPRGAFPAVELQPLRSQTGKLVLILSSNSDAVATQIGALAENQEIGSVIARLIAREPLLDSGPTATESLLQNARAKVIADLGDRLITALKPDDDETKVSASLLHFANAVAAQLGHPLPFRDLDELANWLDTQRRRQ